MSSNYFICRVERFDQLPSLLSSAYSLMFETNDFQDGVVLDTFDQALQDAHQLLIQFGKQVILVDSQTGLIEQDCPGRWSFVRDLSGGSAFSHLSHVSKLRACSTIADVRVSRIIGRLLDDERKTTVRLKGFQVAKQVETDSEQKSEAAFVIVYLEEVKGYGKAYSKIMSALDHLTSEDQGEDFTSLFKALVPHRKPYSNKADVDIYPDISAAQIARELINSYLLIARRNEQGICDDIDTEFLHDYRISIRKIRSILSLFKEVFDDALTLQWKLQFSGIMQKTNQLRDLDVYLIAKDKYLKLVPLPMQEGLFHLFGEFEQLRRQEYKKIKQHLQGDSYGQLVDQLTHQFSREFESSELGSYADRPAGEYASALIWRRYRKVSKMASKIEVDTPDEEVHQVRIQFKKLRYLMEFFAPLYEAAKMEQLLKSLRRLQNNLGRFNDYSVQKDFLTEHISRYKNQAQVDVELIQSVGALVAAIYNKQLDERSKLNENLSAFCHDQMATRFQSLFHTD